MDEAIITLLDLGLNVESVRDLNEGLPEDLPIITKAEREQRMHEEMDAFENDQLDVYMKERKQFREPLPWQCIMMQTQGIDEALLAQQYHEFGELAKQYDGEYDGHEYQASFDEIEGLKWRTENKE